MMPAAIYVWLVPSEHVQEQPGSWRIRKWDTEPFPEANFTLAATPEATDGTVLTNEEALEAYTDGYYGAACPVSGTDGDPHVAGVRSVVDAVMSKYSMHILVPLDEYDRMKHWSNAALESQGEKK